MAGINNNKGNNSNNNQSNNQTKNNNQNNQNQQQQSNQNNGGFSQDNNGKTYSEDELRALLDAGKVSAKSDLLSSLGFSDENELKDLITKVNEENEKGKSDLEKAVAEVDKIKKQLFAEQELRKLAETKLLSLKLGAKPDTVDDLVVLAKSKLGDVEFKEENLGKVLGELKEVYPFYFVDGESSGSAQDMSGKGTSGNIRGVMGKNNKDGNNSRGKSGEGNKGNSGSSGGEDGEKSLAERLIANRKKGKKSSYFTRN